jgi:ribosomal protein S18 acetylase RimI-like enzyme
VREQWGAEIVVVHDTVYRPHELPGFVAVAAGERRGLLTFRMDGGDCEIVTLASRVEGRGVGTGLIDAVVAEARRSRARRVWLITHNDNIDALRFYQRRGFRLVGVNRGAIDRARKVKPEIPEVGRYGIPMHDEVELELVV